MRLSRLCPGVYGGMHHRNGDHCQGTEHLDASQTGFWRRSKGPMDHLGPNRRGRYLPRLTGHRLMGRLRHTRDERTRGGRVVSGIGGRACGHPSRAVGPHSHGSRMARQAVGGEQTERMIYFAIRSPIGPAGRRALAADSLRFTEDGHLPVYRRCVPGNFPTACRAADGQRHG